MPREGGGEGRWGGMEGSGEGGTVALGRVLVSIRRRQEKDRDVGAGKGVTGSAFQAGW